MLMLGLLAGMALILEIPFGRATARRKKIRCLST